MIRRLLEAHYFEFSAAPSAPQIEFWLRELRTPLLLREIATSHSESLEQLKSERRVLDLICHNADDAALYSALHDEEQRERDADRAYWQPLKSELESLRRDTARRHREL